MKAKVIEQIKCEVCLCGFETNKYFFVVLQREDGEENISDFI